MSKITQEIEGSMGVYIPQIRNVDLQEEDLFPGYGFIYLSENISAEQFFNKFEDHKSLLSVLKKVVVEEEGDLKVPAEIDKEIIRDVKQRCAGIKVLRKTKFSEDDRVHITRGIFEGFVGVIKSLDLLEEKVSVGIYFLGSEVAIKVDMEDIEINET